MKIHEITSIVSKSLGISFIIARVIVDEFLEQFDGMLQSIDTMDVSWSPKGKVLMTYTIKGYEEKLTVIADSDMRKSKYMFVPILETEDGERIVFNTLYESNESAMNISGLPPDIKVVGASKVLIRY